MSEILPKAQEWLSGIARIAATAVTAPKINSGTATM